MKNDTTFVRMRNGDHRGGAKISKTGTSLCRIELFLLFAIDRNSNSFRRMTEEGQIYKNCLRFFNFFLKI